MMKIDEASRLIVVVWNMKQSWSIIKADRTCCWMPLFNHSGGLALDQGSWMKRSGWAESSRNTNKKWLRRRFRHAKQRRETQLWQLLLMRFVGAGGWFNDIYFLNGTYNDIHLYTCHWWHRWSTSPLGVLQIMEAQKITMILHSCNDAVKQDERSTLAICEDKLIIVNL